METVVLAIAFLSISFVSAAEFTCSRDSFDVHAVLECVNAVRTNPNKYIPQFTDCELGHMDPVPELIRDDRLQSAADAHTLDMAQTSRTSHHGSDGSFVKERVVDRAGFDGNHIGENVAGGFEDAFSLVEAWMCSEGHRKALMNCKHNVVGTGARCSDEGRCYFTQDFGCHPKNACNCDFNPKLVNNPSPAPSAGPKPSPNEPSEPKETPPSPPPPMKSPPSPSPVPKPVPRPVPRPVLSSPSPSPRTFFPSSSFFRPSSSFGTPQGVSFFTFGR